jgi:hypothetical protein
MIDVLMGYDSKTARAGACTKITSPMPRLVAKSYAPTCLPSSVERRRLCFRGVGLGRAGRHKKINVG